VSYDDLVQEGVIGLLDAARRYEPTRGRSFAAYARKRIFGAIVDHLRLLETTSRATRRNARILDYAEQQFFGKHGRAPSSLELAAATGLRETLATAARTQRSASIDEIFARGGDARGAIAQLVLEERGFDVIEKRDFICSLLRRLSPTQRRVIIRVFLQDWPLEAIADELAVTESRVSQIKQRALVHLRSAAGTDPRARGARGYGVQEPRTVA
jgi:RNA polymerase sigma factor for flagellar operon FliA